MSTPTLPSAHALTIVVFSKDRPLQLDATLRSLRATWSDAEPPAVRVLYRASDAAMEALYAQVARENAGVDLVREAGFRETLLPLLPSAGCVSFVVDDTLFVRRWSARAVAAALRGCPEAIGFSLRLGRNTTYCHTQDRPQRVPPLLEVGEGVLAVDWTRAELDFGYPLELSSSVYRAEELTPLIAQLPFANPNQLEERLDLAKARFASAHPVLLCAPVSIAFCVPLNRVQSTHPNRTSGGADASAEALARAYARGARVDVAAVQGHTPRGCHEELELPILNPAPPDERDAWRAVGAPLPPPPQLKVAALRRAAVEQGCRVLVETGTYLGDTTAACLDAFDRIYTIELGAELHERARARFAEAPHVRCLLGDSGRRIRQVLDELREPALFWLDAHYSEGITARGTSDTPILDELAAILAHPVGGHAILVDDARLFGVDPAYPTIDRVAELVAAAGRGHTVSVDMDIIRITPGSPRAAAAPASPAAEPRPSGAPAVSVVIRCYRQAELLPFSVASVVKQTFTDWEIVIVDDGSPDDTAAVARRLAEALPDRRIRLVRQENGGLCAALNAGVRESAGRYVLPLDADDAIADTFLARTVEALERDPGASIALTDCATFGDRADVLTILRPFDAAHLAEANNASYCSLYRRSVWEDVGGYDLRMSMGYEDWEFWIRCAERGHRAVHVAEPLFFYRVKGEGMYTRARRHDAQLRAQIAVLHPALYDAGRVEAARALLERDPLPAPPRGASAGPVPQRPAPAVSIVIPCYGQAGFLPQAVASVVRQTFTDWEIVVVDDGSPDDAAEVARGLARKLPDGKLRLLSQANAGLPAARNAGIAASRGRYVLPLDADDLLDERFLEFTVSALEATPEAALAFTDVFTFGETRELRRMGPWDAAVLRTRNVACATSLFRRAAWEEAGGYSANMVLGYEDWDLWLAFMERGHGAVHVPEPLFFYRLKPGSMVTQALRHHAQLAARAALNHPRLFGPEVCAQAERVLAAHPLPAGKPAAAAPHRPSAPPPPPRPAPAPEQRAAAPRTRTRTRGHLPASPEDPSESLRVLRETGAWSPGTPLRLHLGCGETRLDGYVNVDLAPTSESVMATVADVFGEITSLRFPPGSVDEVRLHHVLEHFPRVDALALLIRWHAWLREGGVIHLETPDLVGSARLLCSDVDVRTKLATVRHLAGDQTEGWGFHVDHWFGERFARTLTALGFEDLVVEATTWPHPPHLANVAARARKTGDRTLDEQLRAADVLLEDATVAKAEAPMLGRWREQLRERVHGAAGLRPSNVVTAGRSSANEAGATDRLARVPIADDGPASAAEGFGEHRAELNGEYALLSRVVRTGDVVVDVGANKGHWSARLLSDVKPGRLLALEPMPEAFQELSRTLAGRGAVLVEAAASATDGERTFQRIVTDSTLAEMSSFYARSADVRASKGLVYAPLPVRTRSLDGVCAEHGVTAIDYLKIDTEGAELEVLRGAATLLARRSVRMLQFEYGGCFQDSGTTLRQVYELLAAMGYELYRIAPTRLLRIARWRDELENFAHSNYFACPRAEARS